MKLTFTIILAICLTGCTDKLYPIKGQYPNTPIEIPTSNNFDQVWEKLIDMFAQQGLSIKIIDRTSGLIISDRSLLQTTIEDTKGRLIDTSAFIVIQTHRNPISGLTEPITGYSPKLPTKGHSREVQPVSGDWNVRVKKSESGCIINVNLTNIRFEQTLAGYYGKAPTPIVISAFRSTGVFEKTIADIIK